MSDNRRQRIKDIFHQAVELAPEARPAFLHGVCAGDESLRKEVESLLANAVAAVDDTVTMLADLSGRTIGPYQVLGRIGAGGMGVVYQARDTQLDRTVAIKVLPADRLADADRKRRFIQEAKAASALNHPNIVTIHTISHEGGADCMVMEFVAGKALADAIPKKGLPLKEALRIAIDIADAMTAAHAAGTQPALSPDGRMLAFLRGANTFVGNAQLYVKMLPDGEPVQITHDNSRKMSPAFSPDSARIAYTVLSDPGLTPDTYVFSREVVQRNLYRIPLR